jgi:hypothetical protein
LDGSPVNAKIPAQQGGDFRGVRLHGLLVPFPFNGDDVTTGIGAHAYPGLAQIPNSCPSI